MTANAIRGRRRTRMTETVFAEMMAKPQEWGSTRWPRRTSHPWWRRQCVESRDVTGRYQVEGGIIRVAEGWAHGRRWTRA